MRYYIGCNKLLSDLCISALRAHINGDSNSIDWQASRTRAIMGLFLSFNLLSAIFDSVVIKPLESRNVNCVDCVDDGEE